MTVTAPAPLVAMAELSLLAALPLPDSAKGPAAAPRATDQVAVGPPPTAQALWKLAVSGSQQLETLLPMFERAIGETTAAVEPSTLGHLARAVGEAAHRIDAGSADLVARTVPDPAVGRQAPAKVLVKEAPDLPEHPAAVTNDAARQAVKLSLNPAPAQPARPDADAADAEHPTAKLPLVDPPASVARPDADASRQMAKLLLNDASAPTARSVPDAIEPDRASAKFLLREASTLLTRPDADAVDAWRQSARLSLDDASALLARAEQRFDPAQHPEMLWALTQVVGAQRYVTAALGTLGAIRSARPLGQTPSNSGSFNPSGALAIIGMAVLLLVFGVAYGVWVGAGIAIAASAGLVWTWRSVVSTRGVRLELRSTSPPPPSSPAAAPPPRRPP